MSRYPFLRFGQHYKSLIPTTHVPDSSRRNAHAIPAYFIGYVVNAVKNGKAFITYDNGVSNSFSLTCPFHEASIMG